MDLRRFEFDCDLTWHVFFLNADETIYGRYGSRDATSAESRLSLKGLHFAMAKALEAHRSPPAAVRLAGESITPERLAAGKNHRGCIHCHNVKEFQRADAVKAGTFTRESLWVYPLPENIGLTLDVDVGNRVRVVAAGSAAAKAGVKPGDSVTKINGLPIASQADVSYALHKSPIAGTVAIVFENDGKTNTATLELAEGWRKTNLTWRPSLLEILPSVAFGGDELTAAEKSKLGLEAKRAVFRQESPVHSSLKAVGIQAGDIVVGFDGQVIEGKMGDLLAFVRGNYLAGDTVTVNLLRGGKSLAIKLKLK